MHRKKRKKSNQRPVTTICATDRDERFVIRKCAGYIKGFLNTRRDLDRETLDLLLYVLGDTMDLFAVYLGSMVNSDERSDFINALMLTRSDADDHIKVYSDAMVQFDSHAQQEILSHMQHVLDVKIEQCAYRGASQLEKKLALLRKLFSLSDLEVELCTFILIVTFWEQMTDFFVHRLECSRFSSAVSSRSSGKGQDSPTFLALSRYSLAAVRPISKLSAACLADIPPPKHRRSTSLIFRMDNLTFAIATPDRFDQGCSMAFPMIYPALSQTPTGGRLFGTLAVLNHITGRFASEYADFVLLIVPADLKTIFPSAVNSLLGRI